MEFLKVPLAQVKRCVCFVRRSVGETTLKTPSLPARFLREWEVLRCSQTDQCHRGEHQPQTEKHRVMFILLIFIYDVYVTLKITADAELWFFLLFSLLHRYPQNHLCIQDTFPANAGYSWAEEHIIQVYLQLILLNIFLYYEVFIKQQAVLILFDPLQAKDLCFRIQRAALHKPGGDETWEQPH